MVLQAVQQDVQVDRGDVVPDQHIGVQVLQPRQQVRQQRAFARLQCQERPGWPTLGLGLA